MSSNKTITSNTGVLPTHVVACVVENRAREICICKMDTGNLCQLEIFLMVDTHSYTEALLTLSDIMPNEILIHEGSTKSLHSSALTTNIYKLVNRFDNTVSSHQVVPISGQYFDQDRGADLLERILVGKIDNELIAKYTVLAASYCILKYMSNYNGTDFASGSIRIQYSATYTKKMRINRQTAINLELINSTKPITNSNTSTNSNGNSIFQILNHTKTVVGWRLLRANLLEPSADVATIQLRQNVVEQFLIYSVSYDNQVCSLQSLAKNLNKLPDLDKMLSGIITIPKVINAKNAKSTIDTCIMLKQTLLINKDISEIIKHIKETAATNDLITVIAKNINQSMELHEITEAIDNYITESTQYSKSSHMMRHQECFAIKTGISGMLDIARKTYLQSVEDIYELADQYAEAINKDISNTQNVMDCAIAVKVVYSATRGYFITLPNTINPLPDGFVQAVLNKKTIACTTREILSLSDRAKEAIDQALIATHNILQEELLANVVRKNMSVFYQLTDSIAMLDMLLSFANTVMNQQIASDLIYNKTNGKVQVPKYCKPTITEDGPLVIRGGMHPILLNEWNNCLIRTMNVNKSSMQANMKNKHSNASIQELPIATIHDRDMVGNVIEYSTNDIFMNAMDNMHIISGCNGAGKTIYIKQIAISIILAQIGCYIPCSEGSTIPIRDRILSRLGSSDDLEHNLSTFMIEMRECNYICENVTNRSFIIMDEVGRGTSNIDGISLAISIAEYLLNYSSTTFTLFVTHFSQVASLADMYCNARNMHFKTMIQNGQGLRDPIVNENTPLVTTIRYSHQICEGVSMVHNGYGLVLAELCGFPKEVLSEAYSIFEIANRLFPTLLQCTPIDQSETVVYNLLQQILLLGSSSLDDSGLVAYIKMLKQQITPDMLCQIILRIEEELQVIALESSKPQISNVAPKAEGDHKDGTTSEGPNAWDGVDLKHAEIVRTPSETIVRTNNSNILNCHLVTIEPINRNAAVTTNTISTCNKASNTVTISSIDISLAEQCNASTPPPKKMKLDFDILESLIVSP